MGKGKEGKKKTKRKVEGKVKDKPRKKEQGSPAAAEKQPLWFGQKKQTEQTKSSSTSADSSGSSSDRQDARHDKKAKKNREKARRKRKREKKAEDEGASGSRGGNLEPFKRARKSHALHRDQLLLDGDYPCIGIASTQPQPAGPTAMGEPQRAADVLAQRLKALELMLSMLSDQSWGGAAHIELLPAEGATLVEPDESWVATREHVFENKLRQWKGKGVGKEADGKGKAREEKEKVEKGQRWNSKSTWTAAPAEAEQGMK